MLFRSRIGGDRINDFDEWDLDGMVGLPHRRRTAEKDDCSVPVTGVADMVTASSPISD